MVDAKPGIHQLQLKPVTIPGYMITGEKFIRWDEVKLNTFIFEGIWEFVIIDLCILGRNCYERCGNTKSGRIWILFVLDQLESSEFLRNQRQNCAVFRQDLFVCVFKGCGPD